MAGLRLCAALAGSSKTILFSVIGLKVEIVKGGFFFSPVGLTSPALCCALS